MKSLLCLLLAVSTSAFASDLTGKFGIGASVGYPVPAFGNAFNDTADAKLALGVYGRYNFTSNYGLEVGYSRNKFKDTSVKFDNLNFMGLYRTHGSEDFTFVLGAGLAGTRIKNFSPSSIKLSTLLRAGIEANITPNLVLGTHVDYQYVSKILGDMPGSRAHVLTPTVALTWYFGADEVKKAVTEVSNKVTTEVKNVVAKNTDSDNDGVMDSEDKCPNTKADTKVNGYGCSVEEKAEFRINVEFQSGKSDIRAQYNDQIADLANFMKQYPETKVEVQGHTDTSGSKELNTTLSQKRAESVMNAVVNMGIASDRLTAKGYGPTQPIADNSTHEGKQKNRRVVISVK